jgi:hypothetical protein
MGYKKYQNRAHVKKRDAAPLPPSVKKCVECGVELHRGVHALTGEREWHDADGLGSSESPTFHDHEVDHHPRQGGNA